MKINIEAQPTSYFEGIKVSSLPEEIRNEVITMDNIIQQRNNKLLELEILEMAMTHKMLLIKKNLIDSGLLTKSEDTKNENPNKEQ